MGEIISGVGLGLFGWSHQSQPSAGKFWLVFSGKYVKIWVFWGFDWFLGFLV